MYRQLELKFEHLDDLNIKCVPGIRFKGFSNNWEQRKLGDVGETYTGLSGKSKKDFNHGEGKFVTYMNVFLNTVSNPIMIEKVEKDIGQNEVQFGDVFFTRTSETPEDVGMSSVWLENAENIYLNSFCFGYRPIEKFDNYYMAYMLRSSATRKKIAFLAQGISRYNISKNKLMKTVIPKPDISEQKKIGNFFKTLDDTIAIHKRKCEEMKKLNKSYLSYEFSKSNKSFYNLNISDISFVERAKKGKTYKKGSTLIQLSFSKGEMLYLDKDGSVETKYAVLIPKNDKHGRYIYISANHDYKIFFRRMVTTINLQFDTLSFLNIKVHKDDKVIDLICRIYDVIEKYCELLNDYIETLNELKKTLMSKMFV